MEKNGSIDISYVANLARIELTEAEKQTLGAQLNQVLGYFEKLSALNLDGIEPSAHASSLQNVWRMDEAGETFTPEEALSNAPSKRENQIVVPKVVDEA